MDEGLSDISEVLCGIDDYFIKHREMLQYKSKLKEHAFKPTLKSKGEVKMAVPEDIVKLNMFPCFNELPYTHDSRMILACICLWSGLNPEDTLRALRIFAEDKGYYDPGKHLHSIQQVKSLKKYVFTCNSMKDKGLCKCSNGFCKSWFYLKLDFPDEFYKLIEEYKK